MPNSIKLTGWNEFNGKLKKMNSQLTKEADDVVNIAAQDWQGRIARSAPVDQGQLRRTSVVKSGPMSREVVASKEYAPFMEWGTKSRAIVPSDLAEYAAQFKGIAGQTGAKAFIYEWCKRKGIPKEAWYPIYRSIMASGVRPHPFFFIHSVPVEKQLLSDLKDVLNTEH